MEDRAIAFDGSRVMRQSYQENQAGKGRELFD